MGNFSYAPALPFPRGPWSSSRTGTFSDTVACSFADSIGGPFPVTSHRCHHKQKHCSQGSAGGGLPATPLLFHPHTKGSQILMDLSHKAVKRQASFCNAITFSNRPVLLYEQVRLKVGPPSCSLSLCPRLWLPHSGHYDTLPLLLPLPLPLFSSLLILVPLPCSFLSLPV